MSNPILTGAVLIEASGAALNNAGNDEGQRLDNAVVVKQIKIGRSAYPYVSGQAWRRWWREVAYEDFAWKPSPVTREAKSAYTQGDPIQFEDDDIFGYMAAKKATKKKAAKGKKDDKVTPAQAQGTLAMDVEATVEATEVDADAADVSVDAADADGEAESGGTQRRVSPLKNSLLISVLPRAITTDFGHFSRSLPVDNPNMVPFEHEHYTTCLQGAFSLSLQDVGRFECGLMRDLSEKVEAGEGVTVAQQPDGNLKPRVLMLSTQERRKRAADSLRCLARLRHGANLSRNLSDVVPVVVLLGFLDGGNAPFQNLFVPVEGERVALHLERLRSVVKDYADRLLGDKRLFFGIRPGVLHNEAAVLEALGAGMEGVTIQVGTPLEAIESAAKYLESSDLL